MIQTEADRFAEVLTDTPADARVPTCPDWNAGDLLWHLTEVHLFWAGVLSTGAVSDEDVAEVGESIGRRPGTLPELLALRKQATGSLIAALRSLNDADRRWSWWGPDQTVGFTRRMQTYEAAMHRVDAELTAGLAPRSFSEGVAAGAVDHCADVMWGWMPDGAHYTAGGLVELSPSDTGQRWLVEVGHWAATSTESGRSSQGPRAARASDGSPGALFRGSAQDLALWAWGRGGTVEPTGDADAVAQMQRVIAAGIQ